MSDRIERVCELWAIAGGVLLLAIMAVTSVNVIGFGLDRIAQASGTNVPGLPGYEDFVRFAISGAALMFLPYCQAVRGHVSVDLFATAMPDGLRLGLDRFWLGVTAILALFLAYWMGLGLLQSRADAVLSPVLGWPVWPAYAPGIVSLLLWAGIAISQLTERGLND